MVYHGVVSKGCERCRKRKIKCDQRRPSCLRCQRSKKECPGYRKLSDVLFRDESKKVIRKAHQSERTTACVRYSTTNGPQHSSSTVLSDKLSTNGFPFLPVSVSYPLVQPIRELGANFYFAKYTLNEDPFSADYHDWLAQAYSSGGQGLRGAMEAVGMAGLSNMYYAPHVLSKSREHYCRALTALNHALKDQTEAVADTTLMAVILLGMFEKINFDTWNRYSSWAAHVQGAMTLLELRGKGQFSQKRGGLLFVLTRSQILTACMYQNLPVPRALVQTSQNFQASTIRRDWYNQKVASPGSISEVSFRIVNLNAAIQNGQATNSDTVLEQAFQIDKELIAWKSTASHSWMYGTVDSTKTLGVLYYENKCHVYPSLWVAEIWNNWRTLRILVNQIIVHHTPLTHLHDGLERSNAQSIIRNMSTEICISTSSFARTPRMLSLLQQLYVVALEELNPRPLQYFAARQLERIGAENGIRQASLFAQTVFLRLDGEVRGDVDSAGDYAAQAIPRLLVVEHC